MGKTHELYASEVTLALADYFQGTSWLSNIEQGEDKGKRLGVVSLGWSDKLKFYAGSPEKPGIAKAVDEGGYFALLVDKDNKVRVFNRDDADEKTNLWGIEAGRVHHVGGALELQHLQEIIQSYRDGLRKPRSPDVQEAAKPGSNKPR